jgi:LysR family cys regulon transcriptional activator
MTLRQLRYLREVVRRDFNISRAAAALHVTQPGLSRQLRLLESSLGAELFVRSGTRLTALSESGRSIIGIVERMLEDADQVREAVRERTHAARGALTIATTHTQARYALPEVIRRFAARFPEVRLSLRQGTPSEVSSLVLSGNADISIATEPVEPAPGLTMLPCYELHRIVLVPAKHPLLRTGRLTLQQLARHPLITYDFAFIGRSKIARAFESAGLVPNIVLNAIDADVIKTYVEFGLGVAILPAMAFDRRRDQGLRALDASHLFEPNTIHVGIRRNHYLRGYTYAFIEMFAPQLTRAAVEKAIAERPVRAGARVGSAGVSRAP